MIISLTHKKNTHPKQMETIPRASKHTYILNSTHRSPREKNYSVFVWPVRFLLRFLQTEKQTPINKKADAAHRHDSPNASVQLIAEQKHTGHILVKYERKLTLGFRKNAILFFDFAFKVVFFVQEPFFFHFDQKSKQTGDQKSASRIQAKTIVTSIMLESGAETDDTHYPEQQGQYIPDGWRKNHFKV